MALEALRLGPHFAVPEFHIAHRISADNRPIFEHRDGPDDRVLALELIDGQAVNASPNAGNRTGGGHVEAANRRVGASRDEVSILRGRKVRWESKGRRVLCGRKSQRTITPKTNPTLTTFLALGSGFRCHKRSPGERQRANLARSADLDLRNELELVVENAEDADGGVLAANSEGRRGTRCGKGEDGRKSRES